MTLAEASRNFMQAADSMTRVFTLGELEEKVLNLLDRQDALEASGEDPAQLDAELALVDQMMVSKVEGYVSVIRELEVMADARKAEADRLAARAKTAQRHADFLRNRLMVHMQAAGRDRIELGKFTLSIRQNPPRVEVLEPAMVPSEFQRTKITVDVDKVAIRKHFESTGELVAGTDVVRGTSLRIS